MKFDFMSIVRNFRVGSECSSCTPITRGHINDTYVLTTQKADRTDKYVLQKINHAVFKDPPAMMENILRITEHIHDKIQETDPGLARRQLTVVRTSDGLGCYQDAGGNYWRVYNFIENAGTHDTLKSTGLAYEAARMFGWFQRMLIDLPGPALHETIVNFHNTPMRLDAFREALEADAANRAGDAKPEIEFLLENSGLCSVLLDLTDSGQIPERIAHNDTKINNVMLDQVTNRGVCVIDLDTVMPGLSLYDFGDMVRTAVCCAAEDERDLSRVAVDLPMFEALAQGYMAEAGAFLTSAEKNNLVSAGKLITFEQFIRFLTDYLVGDVYYKISRDGHNLDRSRTQMKLVQSMIEQEEAMTESIEGVMQ